MKKTFIPCFVVSAVHSPEFAQSLESEIESGFSFLYDALRPSFVPKRVLMVVDSEVELQQKGEEDASTGTNGGVSGISTTNVNKGVVLSSISRIL